MRAPSLLLVCLLVACQAEHAPVARNEGFPFGATLPLTDMVAYQAGRTREIAALHANATMTSAQLDSIGAAAADLPVERYRRLAESVDEYLKVRNVRVDADGELATNLDSALVQLDSLRVERLVLMVRTVP
jgi:hypothetical protein